MLKILQTDQITLDNSAQGGACSLGMRKQSSSDETQNAILGIGSALLEVQCLGIRCRYSILVPSNMALGAPYYEHDLANMTLYSLQSIPDAPLTATASTAVIR